MTEPTNSFTDRRQDVAVLSPSRRTSFSSNASSISCTTPDYDSGHYSGASDLRPISYSSEDDTGQPSSQQDLRAIRSELERLTKAERWYKNELKVQKRSKLELLEKLYLNERKFVRENRKLQADCKRLYEVCNEIERKKVDEKDDLIRRLKHLEREFEESKQQRQDAACGETSDSKRLQFELQRHQSILSENEHLIETLRSQKQNLLDELRKLTKERDEKLLEIEKRTIALECENRTITKRCLGLVKDKESLEKRLRADSEDSHELQSVRIQLQVHRDEVNRLSSELFESKTSASAEIDALRNQLDETNAKQKTSAEQLALLKSTCAEKQLQNEHLEAEIEQYKKMRANFDKYVALLQGNSVELDTKCAEIDHLQGVVKIQTAQIDELNRNAHDTKIHWQTVTGDLQEQVAARNSELNGRDKLLSELEIKKTSEIQKLRIRLNQLETLNEKLIGQLHGSSSEIVKKSTQLNELNVENDKLKNLLEAKDDELNQRKTHEAFISELQHEIQKLRSDLEDEKTTKQRQIMKIQNGFEESQQKLDQRNEHYRKLEEIYEKSVKDHERYRSEVHTRVDSLTESAQRFTIENGQLKSTIHTQKLALDELERENDELKLQAQNCENLRTELDHCQQLLENYKVTDLSALSETSRKSENPGVVIEIERETSPKVPVPTTTTTCDFECQTECDQLSLQTELAAELRGLRLLQKVKETEHRQQIGRYELHVRTLLGKLRNYRDQEAKGRSRQQVNEYQQKIKTLERQLNLTVHRGSEVDRYKQLNLQLQTNLQSLTDDYKKMLLSTLKPPPKTQLINYSELYKLIDESNSFVPNQNQLIDSIEALKSDIVQLNKAKTTINPAPVNKNLLHPVRRLSLMDELKAADDGFHF